jgi:hypothetical protein
MGGSSANAPLSTGPQLPQTAENGTGVDVAQRHWETFLARGEERDEAYLGGKDRPLPYSYSAPNVAMPLPAAGNDRRDSIVGSPISEPGSPVADDFIPLDQVHRKKPYSLCMENEFASLPRNKHRKN